MSIVKSAGQTPTERILADLCDKTFLRLWSYPSPFKADGKELCDLLVVFDDRVFLFFDRESRKFGDPEKDLQLQWRRWKKEVIDKQIATAEGAKSYLLKFPDKVYVDAKRTMPFPIPIRTDANKIHKIIVAHGAEEACKTASPDNIFGSLAIGYGSRDGSDDNIPFFVSLDRSDICHVFDSFNLPILLTERDTIYDFTQYILEKEKAIRRHDLTYCGEEDLLAHYFSNFDTEGKNYRIGVQEERTDCLIIGEGEWASFVQSNPYRRKKEADRHSYLWDSLIQRTSQNALDGKLLGEGNIFSRPSAIAEMAKEPRFHRRALVHLMNQSIDSFPDTFSARNVAFFPSFYSEKGYVFLQTKFPNEWTEGKDFRAARIEMLRIACGAAKNMNPQLNLVVGIGIEAPKFHRSIAEDFLLMKCDNWTDKDRAEYEELNQPFRFFTTPQLKKRHFHAIEFPKPPKRTGKTGRNESCPCGSGRKFKKCCG
jgi:hypothetical protein